MKAMLKESIRFKNSRGFTLIEVVAVLIILGIFAVVIVSSMSSTSAYSVKSQAEVLKSHIRYAQTMAMNTGVVWGINITDGRHYSLFRDNDTTKTVFLPGADSDPSELDSSGPSLSTGTIRFDKKGTPVQTDGISAVAADPAATVTVSMSGAPSETIRITKNTGFTYIL